MIEYVVPTDGPVDTHEYLDSGATIHQGDIRVVIQIAEMEP